MGISMENINMTIQKMNMPEHVKKRMKNFIENQQLKNWNQSEESLENLKKVNEYRCTKCRDMTFIIVNDEAIPYECRALRQAEDILKKSGISEEFRNKRFSNFDYERSMQMVDAYKVATYYLRNFKKFEKERANSIMFMGQVGAGKSHLSFSIANELMDSGVGVVYMSYREVITRIKQNITDEVYYHRIMGRYKNARVLLIDDLFKGKITESDVNIVFELLNFRYFNKLPVIVSCEMDVEGLLDVDEAIGSRLMEMSKGYLVRFSGKKMNYRMYSS